MLLVGVRQLLHHLQEVCGKIYVALLAYSLWVGLHVLHQPADRRRNGAMGASWVAMRRLVVHQALQFSDPDKRAVLALALKHFNA
jgi:hypothetical protein